MSTIRIAYVVCALASIITKGHAADSFGISYPPESFGNQYLRAYGYDRAAAFAACQADEAYWAAHCNPGYRGGSGCTTIASTPCTAPQSPLWVGSPYCLDGDSYYATGFWYIYDNFRYNIYGYYWCESKTPPPPPPCKFGNGEGIGNPCDPATGNKYHVETDLHDSGSGLSLTRAYHSLTAAADRGFGFGWAAPSVRQLQLAGTTVYVLDRSGRGEPFTCPSSTGDCSGNADATVALSKDAAGYTVTHRQGATERYNSSGALLSETDPSGLMTSYNYDASGRLTSVTGPRGHTVSFSYSGSHIASVTDPNGALYTYSYDANSNLTRVTYPDGTAKLYHYESAAYPHHLTGISYVEANGTITRYANYAYDANGKAILTEHAGGIERFNLNYNSDTQTTVTDAAGTQEVLTFAANLRIKNLVAKVNQGDGKGLAQTFDAHNNLTCKKDEEGRVTTYTYNSTNQKTAMTEGLVGSCANPVATSATRTTNYQYLSATLDLPTLLDGPSVAAGQRKTVAITYGDSRFPNLPTQITQSGYTPSGAPVSRTVTLSYSSTGQVSTIDGPRSDVSDVTTLAYYECTTGGACGQLRRVTNALGHTTTYDAYDGAGRLTQMTDPNGLRTNYTYDPRGRVSSITQTPPVGSARVTQYTYNAAGHVTSVTFPDGRTLSYTYDAAQKLRSVTDNLGHRITYDYDVKGNRTGESTFDPDGTLVRAIEMAYDARNHLARINNGGAITAQLNDALGNLIRITDPNQVAANSGVSTTHSYDALNRLIETINNLSGVTSYGYDSADRLTRVQAPNNATTQYLYDDLGNLLQETSPDRGTTTYAHDAAGNPTSTTDARGITVHYTYDALNRLTAIRYPAAAGENVTLTYDSAPTGSTTACAFGLGRLCAVQDESGITAFAYDPFGNLAQQSKTELGVTYTTRYTYDAGNRVSSMTYPDGRVLTYARDSLGRIEAVTTTVNGTPQTIVANRTYRADGLLRSQTYGNGLTEVRDHDLRGQLIYQSLGSADTRLYTYDPNGNLTQQQRLPAVSSYGYDHLDRLASETDTQTTLGYTYDGNGNRVSAALNTLGATLNYEANTNRLTSLTLGSTTEPLTLDPAGNLTSLFNGRITLTYNNAGRLSALRSGTTTLARYTYNHLGQRTRKATGTTTVYHYDLNGNLIAETLSNGTPIRAYLYAEDLPLAQITKTTSEQLLYLHTDHLDTPRLATDTTQKVLWRWEADAFGALPPNTDPDGDGKRTIVNLRFPGQYFDAESGLHYNWNRYYDPKTGRYLTADPVSVAEHVQMWSTLRATQNLTQLRDQLVGLGGIAELTLASDTLPLELNLYAYVANNPLRWIDPTGENISGGFGGLGGLSGSSSRGLRCEDPKKEKNCAALRDNIINQTCKSIRNPRKRMACFAAAWATYLACLAQD